MGYSIPGLKAETWGTQSVEEDSEPRRPMGANEPEQDPHGRPLQIIPYPRRTMALEA